METPKKNKLSKVKFITVLDRSKIKMKTLSAYIAEDLFNHVRTDAISNGKNISVTVENILVKHYSENR